jgi:DeoR/GlpR family transcriptional regulator of sugar metabolism
VTFARICGLDVVDTLVTDAGIDPDLLDDVESAQVDVIVADHA